MKSLFLPVLACALSLTFTACTSVSKPPYGALLVETGLDLSRTGRIGVVAFSSASDVKLMMPANKTEAASDAIGSIRLMSVPEFGVIASALAAVPYGGAIALSTPVVFPIVAAVGGAVDAAQSWVRAESESTLAPSRETLHVAIAGLRLETHLRDRVLETLRGATREPIAVIDAATLRRLDPGLAERAWRQDSELSTKARQALAQQGLQHLLEIKVHAPALVAPSPIRPDLALNAHVRVRLVSLPDGIELYRRDANYFGTPRPHAEWAANGASLVRAEFDRCVKTTSQTGLSGLRRESAIQHIAAVLR